MQNVLYERLAAERQWLHLGVRQYRFVRRYLERHPQLTLRQVDPLIRELVEYHDLISCLVSDELTRRGDRLLERRRKQAQFRDPQTTLDNFDFNFNKKINRSLIFTIDGTRKQYMEPLATVPLLNMDNPGMRRSPSAAAEELLEIVMRRYERASTLLTSNRPVEDWGKLLGDSATVTAMLDRLLHHGHLLECGPRSWRTTAVQTVGKVPANPAP
ncbi:MAG TPA: ATP-binding protein [Pyrinomonadaceae bacterium]|nr:ATP-binding protein [Pyrinomonadaceae bacterium]